MELQNKLHLCDFECRAHVYILVVLQVLSRYVKKEERAASKPIYFTGKIAPYRTIGDSWLAAKFVSFGMLEDIFPQ